jgi:TolB protein
MIFMRRRLFDLLLVTVVVTAVAATAAAAQDTTKAPAGISLTGRYTATDRIGVAVRPFAGAGAEKSIVDTIGGIVLRDLTNSDRYEMVATPSTLAAGAIDYKGWVSLNTSYLVTGDVVPTAGGYELAITVHDVVYARVKDAKRYRIPPMSGANFRMVVHSISDDVVRTLSGQPGHAATRVVFERQNKATAANGTGSYDLLIVDADGFGLRRVAGGVGAIYSPVWSPDGRKILYALNGSDIIERDVATGTQRVLRHGTGLQTPAYSPDGRRIAFAAWTGTRDANAELFEMDVSGGNVRRLTNARRDDIGPAYSSDGSRIVFMSSRLGLPHIFVMSANGGGETLVSPYVQGMKGYYFAPDFSPTSTEVVFAGHWNSQGVFQIMIADANRPGSQIRQLTTGGDNEDPSWAPDGRHIVYSSGVGEQQLSLYVIDTVTLTKRKLVDGGKLRMSDWSPVLARAADYQVR